MQQVIAVVGLGNMGASLTRGLLKSGLDEKTEIRIFDQHQERVAAFSATRAKPMDRIEELAEQKITWVFCVKPHDLQHLGQSLKGRLHQDSLVISILAGTTLLEIAQRLEFQGPAIRAMPNIAATIGHAATAMCHNKRCQATDLNMAETIFRAVGEAYWTKEELMDTVTGLSGSGPAYIYMVIEALTDGGVKMGLPRDLSHQLSTQTVLGAAAMVKATGLHPAILKDQVTTPAGTTISALHELEERGLRSMFVSAVVKATERSAFLGSQKVQNQKIKDRDS
ncbi:MAG: pyrroline-5-carboxylate reductase [Oligoflexus sp.]